MWSRTTPGVRHRAVRPFASRAASDVDSSCRSDVRAKTPAPQIHGWRTTAARFRHQNDRYAFDWTGRGTGSVHLARYAGCGPVPQRPTQHVAATRAELGEPVRAFRPVLPKRCLGERGEPVDAGARAVGLGQRFGSQFRCRWTMPRSDCTGTGYRGRSARETPRRLTTHRPRAENRALHSSHADAGLVLVECVMRGSSQAGSTKRMRRDARYAVDGAPPPNVRCQPQAVRKKALLDLATSLTWATRRLRRKSSSAGASSANLPLPVGRSERCAAPSPARGPGFLTAAVHAAFQQPLKPWRSSVIGRPVARVGAAGASSACVHCPATVGVAVLTSDGRRPAKRRRHSAVLHHRSRRPSSMGAGCDIDVWSRTTVAVGMCLHDHGKQCLNLASPSTTKRWRDT